MPRNRHKIRCAAPDCHNWAMRNAAHCRSHRDRELGPRGGGAPAGNLNALLHGRHARTLHPEGNSPVGALLQAGLSAELQPALDQLLDKLAKVSQDLRRRLDDPYKTLVALRAVHQIAVSIAAARKFDAELETFLHRLPQPHRDRMQAVFREKFSQFPPERRLTLLRRARRLYRQRTTARQ